MHRSLLRLGIALASALALMATAPLPAYASFSNTADTTWMTNGIVYTITDSADTVYVGGKFTSIDQAQIMAQVAESNARLAAFANP